MIIHTVYKETKETAWESSAIDHMACLGLRVLMIFLTQPTYLDRSEGGSEPFKVSILI